MFCRFTVGRRRVMATVAEPVVHGKPVVSQLKTNTLTLFDSTRIATSSVAPAYTLAATAALLVSGVGLASPAAILVGFLPVLFIALAGSERTNIVPLQRST